MILPFTPLAMSFDEVNYFVDMPPEMKDQGVTEDRLQLLRNMTGAFRPGILTALMGVSGAGKTILMDVLAGRKIGGYIEEDIRISGYPKNQETFARISGYCEQNDIHSPSGHSEGIINIAGVNNCSTVQPLVAIERTVFYRERAAGMYSAFPYALAQVLVEIPYVLVETILFAFVIYSMMSFQWTAAKFLWFFYVSFFSFLYFTYYGMMTVSLSPNHQVAAIFAATFYSVFNLFSGFFIPRPRIPKWWVWYYWICPLQWTVYGLIVTQYGDLEDKIIVPGQTDKQHIKDYVKNHYGYDIGFIPVVAVVLAGFALFFAFMFAVCIKKLNFQQR